MKKFHFLLLAFLISAHVSAIDNETYTLLKVSGSSVPTIDGEVDPIWSVADRVTIDKYPANTQEGTNVIPDDSLDYAVTFSALWSQDGMYFLIYYSDEDIVIVEDYDAANSISADKWWVDDHVNLLFSPDLNNTAMEDCKRELAYQPGVDQEEKCSSSEWLPDASIQTSMISTKWSADKHILETFIDWDAFTPYNTIEDGASVFFEVRGRDDDQTTGGSSWETLVQWATDNADVQSDASYFGEGVLSATFANTVSVTDNAADVFSVYPNPASGLLTIQSDNEINGNIILSNSIGQKIDEITPKGNRAVIETSKLHAGIYFVSVNDKTVKLMVK